MLEKIKGYTNLVLKKFAEFFKAKNERMMIDDYEWLMKEKEMKMNKLQHEIIKLNRRIKNLKVENDYKISEQQMKQKLNDFEKVPVLSNHPQ